jgi:pimeloyl-ACP methyl ester carboxylesterase
MDMEAVRQALGYQLLDYYGGSYGSVDAQAYVVRYPQHVRALILDSGFTVTDPAHVYAFGQGVPAALIHSLDLVCARDPTCHAADADPEATLTALIRRVQQTPVKGHPSDASGSTVVVDEAAVANLLANANGPDLVEAGSALRNNDAQPLVDLAAKNPPLFPTGDDLSVFSDGANAAGFCNDQDFPYRRSDQPAIRRAQLDAALAALPADVFAPLSKGAWAAVDVPDFCINWPSPARFVPVVPPDTTFPDVPTLILSGDVDRNVPTVLTRQLLSEFPHAAWVVVAGAGHPTMSASGSCVGAIGAEFLSTLKVGDTSCATTPG